LCPEEFPNWNPFRKIIGRGTINRIREEEMPLSIDSRDDWIIFNPVYGIISRGIDCVATFDAAAQLSRGWPPPPLFFLSTQRGRFLSN
jgi:hypothetical protein